MYYLCGENKGADQLCGTHSRSAPLFLHIQKSGFLMMQLKLFHFPMKTCCDSLLASTNQFELGFHGELTVIIQLLSNRHLIYSPGNDYSTLRNDIFFNVIDNKKQTSKDIVKIIAYQGL